MCCPASCRSKRYRHGTYTCRSVKKPSCCAIGTHMLKCQRRFLSCTCWAPHTHTSALLYWHSTFSSLWQSLSVLYHTGWISFPVGLIWLHGSASWARVAHTECHWQRGVAQLLDTCQHVWSVRCSCAHLFSDLSPPSGVPWPAWSRATAASLSSAPPPPPLTNRSRARWSPGRNWKMTSTPTIPHFHLPHRQRRSWHSSPLDFLLHSLSELKHACTNG